MRWGWLRVKTTVMTRYVLQDNASPLMSRLYWEIYLSSTEVNLFAQVTTISHLTPCTVGLPQQGWLTYIFTDCFDQTVTNSGDLNELTGWVTWSCSGGVQVKLVYSTLSKSARWPEHHALLFSLCRHILVVILTTQCELIIEIISLSSLASPTLFLPYICGRGGRKGSGSSSINDLCKWHHRFIVSSFTRRLKSIESQIFRCR